MKFNYTLFYLFTMCLISYSNKSVNGKSESNSYELTNIENKQSKISSNKENDNFDSLI